MKSTLNFLCVVRITVLKSSETVEQGMISVYVEGTMYVGKSIDLHKSLT